jgi:hypothetical protein
MNSKDSTFNFKERDREREEGESCGKIFPEDNLFCITLRSSTFLLISLEMKREDIFNIFIAAKMNEVFQFFL